jgi:hypothetical protein
LERIGVREAPWLMTDAEGKVRPTYKPLLFLSTETIRSSKEEVFSEVVASSPLRSIRWYRFKGATQVLIIQSLKMPNWTYSSRKGSTWSISKVGDAQLDWWNEKISQHSRIVKITTGFRFSLEVLRFPLLSSRFRDSLSKAGACGFAIDFSQGIRHWVLSWCTALRI